MGRKTESQPIRFEPNERLIGVYKEHHVRKQGGRQLAYIVEDKQTEYLLMAQRLSTLVSTINAIVKEKPDQVTVVRQDCTKSFGPRATPEAFTQNTGGRLPHAT